MRGPLSKILTPHMTKLSNFPHAIYDLTKNYTATLFMTIAAGTVALNIIY